MSLHLSRQIGHLKKSLLVLSARIEERVLDAVTALENRDPDLAQGVLDSERDINRSVFEIEEECLHTLALHQPVAFDLRYLVAVLKINADLQRIGGLATNIAELALSLSQRPRLTQMPFDVAGMARMVRGMVKQSLDALVNIDPDLADTVCARDDEVDRQHREMYAKIEQAIRRDPELVTTYFHLVSVSRHLERIADHAVNIARDVIYMARGELPYNQGG